MSLVCGLYTFTLRYIACRDLLQPTARLTAATGNFFSTCAPSGLKLNLNLK